MSTGDPDTIVELFRQAAWGAEDWCDALAMLARASRSHVAHLAGVDRHFGLALNKISGAPPDGVAAYFEAKGDDPATNPRTRALLRSRPLHCLTDEDFVSEQARATLPIYRGFFRQFDVPYAMQVRLDTGPDLSGGIVVMRARSQGPVDPAALALLRATAAGITSAVRGGVTLGTAHDASVLATTETIAGPAILLGPALRIVGLSPDAETILRAGIHLSARGGRLRAPEPQTAEALSVAYRAVTCPAVAARAVRPVVLRTRTGQPPLLADMCPLPERTSGPLSQATALIAIRVPRPGDDAIASATLRQRFALTAAEAEVALLLAEGCDPAAIAARRGAAIATVRSQLKALFHKTDTHRQAELVVKVRTCR